MCHRDTDIGGFGMDVGKEKGSCWPEVNLLKTYRFVSYKCVNCF